jgi:integrase/recombinase XerC
MESIDHLLSEFFINKSSQTSKSYRSDLENFRRYLNLKNINDTIAHVIYAPHSQANLIVLHYKVEMLKTGTKPGTINRRLSTIRSLVRLAYNTGLIPWRLDITNEPLSPNRLVEGDGEQIFQKVLKAAKNQKSTLKARRDTAIVRLLHDLALKRHSITALDLSDLNVSRRKLAVEIPGTKERVVKKLPLTTIKCLKNWLEIRGIKKGPLFVNFDHAGKGQRLTGSSIYRIVKQLGTECGIKASPQMIRNAAIQKALKIANIEGIESTQLIQFSNHRNPASLRRFQSKSMDIQSAISKLLSD